MCDREAGKLHVLLLCNADYPSSGDTEACYCFIKYETVARAGITSE